jgi:ABC-type transport system involved in multi-copper enzyme maturation permease subunit
VSAAAAVGRLEAAGVVRARWFLLSVILSGGLVLLFVAVGYRESSVLGFTGLGRVATGVVQAGLTFVPLLATLSTTQAVATARQNGVLEWYLSNPVSRASCFWGIYLPRLAAVALPVIAAVLLVGLGTAFSARPLPIGELARFVALLLGQAACFTAIGMCVGVYARTVDRALLGGLTAWLAAAALVDFVLLGVLLRWHLHPAAVFLLAGVNPVQAGRIAVLVGTDPELGVLGPVGTWIATTLGPTLALTYGLTWPFVVAAAALAAARIGFGRRDAS